MLTIKDKENLHKEIRKILELRRAEDMAHHWGIGNINMMGLDDAENEIWNLFIKALCWFGTDQSDEGYIGEDMEDRVHTEYSEGFKRGYNTAKGEMRKRYANYKEKEEK